MKKNIIYLFIIFIFLTACNNKKHGYDDIEELYRESLIALKSKDMDKVNEFIKRLFPDRNSAYYMMENNCSYRGYPEGLKQYPYAVDSAIVIYTKVFYNYALSIERKGSLNDLEFIGFESPLSLEPLDERRCKCQDVLFDSPFALFVSKKNNDTIIYSFGELLRVDGKWKSFTDFKLY